MAKDTSKNCCEQFKTVIGGQALIEGIMMRGPEKDAVVVRGKDGLSVEVTRRVLPSEKSPLRWPLIRGVYNFFDAQVSGVKSLMRSADLSPEEGETVESSKLDKWLEKKLGDEKFQQYLIGIAVAMGMGMSIVGMLVGVCVGMLMTMSAGHIVGKMHNIFSFIWYAPRGVANFVEIEYNQEKSPERRKLLCLISTIIMITLIYTPTESPIPTVTFTKTRKRLSTDWLAPLAILKR